MLLSLVTNGYLLYYDYFAGSCMQFARPYHQLLLCSSLLFRHSNTVSGFVRAMPCLTRSTRRTLETGVSLSAYNKRIKTENCDDAVEVSISTSSNVTALTPTKKKSVKSSTAAAAIVTPTSAATVSVTETVSETSQKSTITSPPDGWQEIYSLVEELRQDRTAPCDHSGCEALANVTSFSPKEVRFQALLSLMLSSQTKDATVAQAVRNMQQCGVATVAAIAAMTSVELNGYINKVGFHNLKTKYIQETVGILLERYDGDIPPNAQEMQQLPGVGPKMAYICETVAWNRASGIGVDTHMHRIFNQLGWVKSKTPEQTRVQLQAWLPRDKWMEVNLLWVGFGQEVQQFKPRILRKALDCSRPKDALRLLKRCGIDYAKESKNLDLVDEVKRALLSDF